MLKLKEEGIFEKFLQNEFKTKEECGDFIELNLEEEGSDSEFITDCFWEVYQEYKEHFSFDIDE